MLCRTIYYTYRRKISSWNLTKYTLHWNILCKKREEKSSMKTTSEIKTCKSWGKLSSMMTKVRLHSTLFAVVSTVIMFVQIHCIGMCKTLLLIHTTNMTIASHGNWRKHKKINWHLRLWNECVRSTCIVQFYNWTKYSCKGIKKKRIKVCTSYQQVCKYVYSNTPGSGNVSIAVMRPLICHNGGSFCWMKF